MELEGRAGHFDVEPVGEEDIEDADGEGCEEKPAAESGVGDGVFAPLLGEIVGNKEKAEDFGETEEEEIPRHGVGIEEESDHHKQRQIKEDGTLHHPAGEKGIS